MKERLFFLILSLMMAAPSNGTDITSLAKGVSIKTVNAIRISESPDVLKVVLTLYNENQQSIRIRNPKFQVIVNPKGHPPVELPEKQDFEKSSPYLKDVISNLGGDEQMLPTSRLELGETIPKGDFLIHGCVEFNERGGKCREPGQGLMQADIRLTGSLMQRKIVIYKLINYLGLPGANKDIALVGNADVGLSIKDKWDYSALKFEWLIYKPKVKSEHLFTGW